MCRSTELPSAKVHSDILQNIMVEMVVVVGEKVDEELNERVED